MYDEFLPDRVVSSHKARSRGERPVPCVFYRASSFAPRGWPAERVHALTDIEHDTHADAVRAMVRSLAGDVDPAGVEQVMRALELLEAVL